ncbi:CDP-glucose 4,6-dehydratase [Tumidithrix elongata RA019]|uniref:CDP-glucose 4,6-dehydratase n=1 Tax=Tumidithrix elongata BACA0141 TaxID=2716417 RepID=A0AAW9Q944_9CYAN|nr:CDP-glucose 4,6-dehydratase [Tumidithrix elongata RA019]
MIPSFWQGKRVLLTGHTGFKGSWLSVWLQTLGAELLGYSLPTQTQPSLFDLAKVGDRMNSIFGDIRNLDRLCEVVVDFQPEIIIHMAAQALVRQSYITPVDTYVVNVMGTVNLLEAVRQVGGVRAFVNVTSDKCYENREWVWGYRENEPMGGYDPYSSSKGCAELVTAAYRNSFFNLADYAKHGTGIATARAGNVIGGGDWACDRLIPDVLRSWQSGKPAILRYPQAIRPWQHVLEPLSGYLTLAEWLYHDGVTYSGAWNFGPNESDAKPVGWVVDRMQELWGDDVSWSQETLPQPHEANYLKLDCSKARSQLKWQPKLDVQTALIWVIEWTRALQSGANMRDVTVDQIREFSSFKSS